MQASQLVRPDGGVHGAHDIPQLCRVGIAGCVGKPHFVHARCHQGFGQFYHLCLWHHAFQRAAKGRAHTALEAHGIGCGLYHCCNAARFFEHLCMGFAQVFEAVCFAGRQRQRELVRTCSDGRFGAAGIGHQHGHCQARVGAGMGHHIGCIGELWQELCRHETAHFDLADAGTCQRIDPCAFDRSGKSPVNRLESIAWTYFRDQDCLRHGVSLWACPHCCPDICRGRRRL